MLLTFKNKLILQQEIFKQALDKLNYKIPTFILEALIRLGFNDKRTLSKIDENNSEGLFNQLERLVSQNYILKFI